MTPANVSAQLDPGLEPRWHGYHNGRVDVFALPSDPVPLLSLFLLDTNPLVQEYMAQGSGVFNFSRGLGWAADAAYDSIQGREMFRRYADEQARALAEGLAESRAVWKIVVGHHPVYSYCTDHGSQAELARLNGVMRRGGAHGYMNGHDHNLQLITPLGGGATPSLSPPFYLTTGAGSYAYNGQKVPTDGSLRFNYTGQSFNSVTLNSSALVITSYSNTGKKVGVYSQAWQPPPACAQGGVLGMRGVEGLEDDPRCGAAPPPAASFAPPYAGAAPPPPPQPFDSYVLSAALSLPTVNASLATGWDYLMFDDASQLLFMGRRNDGLCVANGANGALVPLGCLSATLGSNGAAIMPGSTGRIGVSFNNYANPKSATIFKMPDASMAPASLPSLYLGEFIFDPTDQGPDAGIYIPAIDAIAFTFTGRRGPPGTLSAVIPFRLTARARAGLICSHACLEPVNYTVFEQGVDEGGLESPKAISPTDDSIWLLLEGAGVAARLSMANNSLLATLDLSREGCSAPAALALDTANNLLFVGCRGGALPGNLGLGGPLFLVLNASALRSPTTVASDVLFSSPIGRHVDGMAYLPPAAGRSGRIFVSCGADATIVVFEQSLDGKGYRPLEAIATRPGAKTLAMDAARRRLFTMAPAGSKQFSGGGAISDSLDGSEPFYPTVWSANTFTALAYSPQN